ncbi:MAG: ferrochelatase [Deltaproteobacteria bacterium]|nr:ferrochelatase [Deltaproteobacteria bacterium]
MSGDPNCEAVMLIGFGGPTTDAEVRPFLNRVLAGKRVPLDRYEEVVRHYQVLGGRSPYNEITMRQAAAVTRKLRLRGIQAPVVAGFLHMPPFLDDALRDLEKRGVGRALGFVLAPHRCEASWERYLAAMKSVRKDLGGGAPEVDYPSPWHEQSLFVAAVVDRIRAAVEQLDPPVRERTHLIFTAHSIPLPMDNRAGYVEQLNQSARRIAQQLGWSHWTVAFQSRSGSRGDPWLEPDIKDILRGLAGQQAVVMPLGFTCDHVEVLYDLDVEAAAVAREAGVRMVRAATVGEHPKFIDMIATIAAEHLSSTSQPPA